MTSVFRPVALGAALLGLVAGAFVLWFVRSADPSTHSDAIPVFSSAEFGWLADTEFLPPDSGPGPVTFDKAHPYVRNNTVGQPTFRISDLSNPILQPWVVERMRRDNDEVLAGKFAFTARSSCLPAGVPGFLVFGCGARTVYFIQMRDKVVMISDGDAQVRHVYLNVAHTTNPKPSWYGESVGRYEDGDTLVIDTIGLNEWLLDAYHPEDGSSRWHSDKMHVVERLRFTDATNASYDVTIDDPVIFEKPWVEQWAMQLKPNWKLLEFICDDNDRCRTGNCTEADVQKSATK